MAPSPTLPPPPQGILPTGTTCKSLVPNDPGDPMALLQDRGINETNKFNLWALFNVLKLFNNFKKNNSYNIGLSYAKQLMAVTKLLDEAILAPELTNNVCPATQEDLRQAIEDNKASLGSNLHSFPTTNTQTYTNTVRGPIKSFHPFAAKPLAPTEVHEKDIFISLKIQ